uniref:Major facilitator superfamily (MFS) profile domain-containing protein n=1 Tax=Amphimedon queenslandica TaxID=400682 RepID=A0A1X7ULK3_AMPQE
TTTKPACCRRSKMKIDCYVLRKLPIKQISRFRLNWVIIWSMTYLTGTTNYITIPLLHQFITSSSNTTDSQVVPGLGLSETWYSWVISAQSIGIFVGALLFSVFARSFYYKYIIIGSLFILMLSGIFFSFAVNGWMVITGRFLAGFYIGIGQPLTRTYTGESSDKVIQMRKEASLRPTEQNSKEKSSLKYTNYFIQFATTVTGLAVAPEMNE